MVVYERENDFVMVRQDDHARLSGDIAAQWRHADFSGDKIRENVVLAISDHDRAWIELDEAPIWNDVTRAPYSFVDMPNEIKLAHYRKGIDETEAVSPYAGLLCSLHYLAFTQHSQAQAAVEFSRWELARQQRLKQSLGKMDEKSQQELEFHWLLMQFCDRLSLYVCLNEPGVSKEDEFPWYRKGFDLSEKLSATHGEKVVAHWSEPGRIRLFPNPFPRSFSATVLVRIVKKAEIDQHGLRAACRAAVVSKRTVEFV
ncbi:DUF3891 family protein [Alicyclobacillus tolerans]|uniref:DUF3891 family protein n=1 Tax=Alicyclobacillus tolerans TaxID=90970 RepID=UPI001F447438|nr:DUF3891 family protein [Alicyclobacillus tolerans]MCF8563364.1 DUF3891 family protein [Alicyclobacillus tolerans]